MTEAVSSVATGGAADAPRRGRRPRRLEPLDVLTAAATLFDRKGYDQTKVQDIAASLGISKPTVYNFYAGKTEILNEIFEYIIQGAERILDEVEQIPDGAEALRAFVHKSLAFGAANRSMMNVFMSDERSLPGALRERHNRWSRDAYHRLRDLVEKAEGPNGPVDARIATFAITAFVNQLGSWFSQKGGLSLEEVADGFSNMLEMGIRHDQSGHSRR